MKRILYLLAMFTGIRAAFNTVRSYFLPKLRVAILDGEVMDFAEYGKIRIRVNARPVPNSLESGAKTGMISLYLASPGISNLLYGFMRLTSHFGYGHVEIAFYEVQEKVTIFAIRNILRSNIERLSLRQRFDGLKLSSDDDEIILLKRILGKLNSLGLTTTFAPPEECVSLAISQSLLIPGKQAAAIVALRRKYKRIEKKLMIDRSVVGKRCDESTYQVNAR